MRQIIFLFSFISATICFAQDAQNTVRDSSWLLNRKGVFFQARLTVQSNGLETITYTPIGDTVTTTRVFVNNIQAEAQRMATDANVVRQYRNAVGELIRFAREIPATINRIPLDSIAKSEVHLYNADYWEVNGLGIRFRRTAAGLYQWRNDTATIWRPFAYLGSIIRLNNLNGYTTDFYKDGPRWRTINSQYVLKPKNVASRASVPTEEDAPAPPPATLNANGTVTISNYTYKYNYKSKKWVKI